MQCFVAHFIVALDVGSVEDERLLGRLYHADLAELVDEETIIDQLAMYGRRVVALPKLLQVCRIRGIWCDCVLLAPKHVVVIRRCKLDEVTEILS
jgi:hypothetical protein